MVVGVNDADDGQTGGHGFAQSLLVVGRVGHEQDVGLDVGAESGVGQRTWDETANSGVCTNGLGEHAGRALSVLASTDDHDGGCIIGVQESSNGANTSIGDVDVKKVKTVFSDTVDEAAHVSALLLGTDVHGVLLVGFGGHE